MTAKHKLNTAYVNGALLLAAVLGAMTDSSLVFFLSIIGLLVANVAFGLIRR